MRKPSTPRSSQKRSTSYIAAAHRRVAPVEVRLLLQEGVVVVLAGRLVPLPGRAAEIAEPVVGRPAVGRRIAPDVPVAFRIVARGAALDEPGMLVGRVVGHEVEHQLEPARVRCREQRVEIGERAEQRIDVAVVGDVVAEIGHRRGIDRRDPDRVDAERSPDSRAVCSIPSGRRCRRRSCPGRSADRSGR